MEGALLQYVDKWLCGGWLAHQQPSGWKSSDVSTMSAGESLHSIDRREHV